MNNTTRKMLRVAVAAVLIVEAADAATAAAKAVKWPRADPHRPGHLSRGPLRQRIRYAQHVLRGHPLAYRLKIENGSIMSTEGEQNMIAHCTIKGAQAPDQGREPMWHHPWSWERHVPAPTQGVIRVPPNRRWQGR